MFNPMMAQSEMERRYTFVTEGAQSARWLHRLAKDRLHAWSDRFGPEAHSENNHKGREGTQSFPFFIPG